MLRLEKARAEDFADVFPLIKALWSYNSYDEEATRKVFKHIAESESSFAFVAREYAESAAGAEIAAYVELTGPAGTAPAGQACAVPAGQTCQPVTVPASSAGRVVGFCHGDYFPTLWMCGETCYLSGIITEEHEQGRGIGTKMLEHVKALAALRGCKAIILESGLQRKAAHQFYEAHGFEKSCYGFECVL